MGRGRVIAAHGEGRYTIEIVEDRARAESARVMAVQRLSQLDQKIAQLGQEISAAQSAVEQAAADQNSAIVLYRQQMLETGESDVDLTAYAITVVEASAKRDALRTQQAQHKTTRLTLQSRIQRIDALPPLRQIEAWCADYTEDLSGDVATAEVPGEIGQVIIKPGFHDASAWSPSVDGAIQPALSGTPASVFYNLAMLPGWQKWRPTFRVGTISNVDNDLCDVTLDTATSSQQGLNVNAQSHYSGVPIMYMDCNGAAFEDGDRALVAFSGNTGQPMVVGFEREPRECDDVAVLLVPITLECWINHGLRDQPSNWWPNLPDGLWAAAWIGAYRLIAERNNCIFYRGNLAAECAMADAENNLPDGEQVSLGENRAGPTLGFPRIGYSYSDGEAVYQRYNATLYGIAFASTGLSGGKNWSAIRPHVHKLLSFKIGEHFFEGVDVSAGVRFGYRECGSYNESRRIANQHVAGRPHESGFFYPFEADTFTNKNFVLTRNDFHYVDEEGATWVPEGVIQPLDGKGVHAFNGENWWSHESIINPQYIERTFYYRVVMRRVSRS